MMAAQSEFEGLAESPVGWSLAAEPATAIWQAVATELTAAVGSARHPLHLLTVATVDATGGPQARTVVLRGFDADCRELRFHTDIRSPKAEQINAESRVALHWYDATRRLQIRISSRAMVHHGNVIAGAAWHGSQLMSRACYTTGDPPGTPLEDFLPAPQPPAADDDRGLACFAVVCCQFDAIELLVLRASGHERIRLLFTGNELIREILAP